jgi:hypothetical protein
MDSYQVSTKALFLGVRRQEREADLSRQSSVEVKNGGTIPPFPISLPVIKHKDNFNFYTILRTQYETPVKSILLDHIETVRLAAALLI